MFSSRSVLILGKRCGSGRNPVVRKAYAAGLRQCQPAMAFSTSVDQGSIGSPPLGSFTGSTYNPLDAEQEAKWRAGRAAFKKHAGKAWEDRPKMVIMGTGWASMNLLQNLNEGTLKEYSIMVISPANHFVNTPLLPSVTVGTLGPRTIAEPIRNVIVGHRKRTPEAWIKFNEVAATKVDVKNKRIRVSTSQVEGSAAFRQKSALQVQSATVKHDYWIEYDVLVCGVGATSNTFGTPGALEHCVFLKTIKDAMKIRSTLLDCFETAAVYGTPDEEIDRLLKFVIVGAGPTGVEIAAEINDFVREDIIPRYSGFKDRTIKVQVIEMSDKMLGTYDKLIQAYCAERFFKLDIEMLVEHQVKKVNPQSVEVLDLKTGETKELPFGMCVWASGIRPNSVSLDMAKQIHGGGMLLVDENLRVQGTGGSIFAMGDCAKLQKPAMKGKARELFAQADLNNDGVLDVAEFQKLVSNARKQFPHLESFLGEVSKESVRKFYEKVDKAHADYQGITLADFEATLADVDKYLRPLPPTAQVAAQQGEYLAKILNNVSYPELGHEEGFTPKFEYKHAGSMAYVGGEHAVIDSPVFGVSSGLLTYVLWKGVYFGKSISLTMKMNMMFDWAKAWFLGRDTSRF